MTDDSEKRANRHLRNHSGRLTDEAIEMAKVDALASIALALERQNKLLEDQNEILYDIETNTRKV